MTNHLKNVTWRAQGDADDYFMLNDQRWLCSIRLNGELHTPQQEELLRRLVASVNVCSDLSLEELEKLSCPCTNFSRIGNPCSPECAELVLSLHKQELGKELVPVDVTSKRIVEISRKANQ